MTKISVNTKQKYEVIFQRGGIASLGQLLLPLHSQCRVLIVCDENVEKLYLQIAMHTLKANGYGVFTHVLRCGEQNKNFASYQSVLNALLQNGFTRSDLLIALGGGVIGDVVGFVAATYMRGIDYVQVPTTLMAMIDSAIGGKTAIDFGGIKNSVGAFHQPILVVEDVSALDTLADCEWKNGLGEGLKYAVLQGGSIYEIARCGIDANNVEKFAIECVKYKAKIVEGDEKDRGERKLLNLGHTVAHALEAQSGYVLKHGIAVAKGVLVMAQAAKKAGEIKDKDFEKIIALLQTFGFYDNGEIAVELLEEYFAHDKKACGTDSICFVKIKGIGNCGLQTVPQKEFVKYLRI